MEVKIKFHPDISQASNWLLVAPAHQHSRRIYNTTNRTTAKNKMNKTTLKESMSKKKKCMRCKNKTERTEKLFCQSPSHHKCQKMEPTSLRSTKQESNLRELNNYKVSKPHLKPFNIFPIDINADEFNIFQQYSEEEIENFKCIFDMFDKDKTGVVNVQDLQTIMKSLGRDPQEAIDLLEELDFDPAGQMSFEEFLRIMKNLENRLVASKQDEMMGQAPGQEGQPGEGVDPNMMPKEGSFEERNKYGCLLPRTGVHFLPDSKVVDFLRLLNDYRKKCCKEMNLTEARRAALKFEDLKNKEMLRQL